MSRLKNIFRAITDKRLPQKHRDFLYALSFDHSGAPMYNNFTAGIGGCYEAIPE